MYIYYIVRRKNFFENTTKNYKGQLLDAKYKLFLDICKTLKVHWSSSTEIVSMISADASLTDTMDDVSTHDVSKSTSSVKAVIGTKGIICGLDNFILISMYRIQKDSSN